MQILVKFLKSLLMMAVSAFVISAIATAIGVAFIGPLVPGVNPFHVLSTLAWSIFILQIFFFALFTWREEIRPALSVMREHKVSFAFALENHRLSRRFIRFKIAKPEGYDPWEREEFLEFMNDSKRAKRAD